MCAGELHLTPLRGVIQLRPSLSRLDRADSLRASGVGGSSEGEGTESEGEEAKPVQIRFARPTNSSSARCARRVWLFINSWGDTHIAVHISFHTHTHAHTHTHVWTGSFARRPSFQQQEQQHAEEAWLPLAYQGVHSEAATEERRLLFATTEDQGSVFSLTQREYLDQVCPVEGPRESEAPIRPVGVLSLDQLKSMPLPQQVSLSCRHCLRLRSGRVDLTSLTVYLHVVAEVNLTGPYA